MKVCPPNILVNGPSQSPGATITGHFLFICEWYLWWSVTQSLYKYPWSREVISSIWTNILGPGKWSAVCVPVAGQIPGGIQCNTNAMQYDTRKCDTSTNIYGRGGGQRSDAELHKVNISIIRDNGNTHFSRKLSPWIQPLKAGKYRFLTETCFFHIRNVSLTETSSWHRNMFLSVKQVTVR